jgi:predicted helicase
MFHYVYDILHAPEYRARFVSNLTKALPRIPNEPDSWASSKAVRDFVNWHLNS